MHGARRFLIDWLKKSGWYGLDAAAAFAVILAMLWLFLLMVYSVTTERAIYHLDVVIQAWMTDLLSPRVARWVVLITALGDTIGITLGVGVVGLVLLYRRYWQSLIGLLLASGCGGLVLRGLKAFFRRERPVEQVIDAGGYAFPSGHAFAATVFYGYLVFLAWKHLRSAWARTCITVVSVLLVILIGASRVLLNVHWLTDVLGGHAAGLLWLTASLVIVRHVSRKRGLGDG